MLLPVYKMFACPKYFLLLIFLYAFKECYGADDDDSGTGSYLDAFSQLDEFMTMKTMLKEEDEKEWEEKERERMQEVLDTDKELLEEVEEGLEKVKEKEKNDDEGRKEKNQIDKTVAVIEMEKDVISSLQELITEPNEAENPSLTTSSEKEEAPEDTFAVWNTNNKICILANFEAVFSIKYSGKNGEQKAEISVPKTANVKGKCDSHTKSPLLQVSWQKYAFTMFFNKTEEDTWIASTMELNYDTSEPLFDDATNPGKVIARSKPLRLFETPLKKSYACTAQETVLMHSGNKQTVTGRLKGLQLQPYDVENGEFAPAHRCNKVVIDSLDSAPYVQDETVPLAVGCTLAIITLILLVGFSVHRALTAAKQGYNDVK